MEGIIKTYTGLFVNVTKPEKKHIRIEDIAHALSNIGRYNGHYPVFLSVGYHSLKVLEKVRKRSDFTAKMGLHALLHDASEAYLCDLPKPIKNANRAYWGYEQEMMDVVFDKFQLNEAEYLEVIEEADKAVFEDEWHMWTHFDENPIKINKSNEQVKQAYMKAFYELVNIRNLYEREDSK